MDSRLFSVKNKFNIMCIKFDVKNFEVRNGNDTLFDKIKSLRN